MNRFFGRLFVKWSPQLKVWVWIWSELWELTATEPKNSFRVDNKSNSRRRGSVWPHATLALHLKMA